MKVTLLHATPLEVTDRAIGKCWDKPSKDGEINRDRIYRVGCKNKHGSTLEHVSFTFDIDGVSRALLQELARHRIASPSVKSTRYTLGELKDAYTFYDQDLDNVLFTEAKHFLVMTGDIEIDEMSIIALANLQYLLREGKSNDKVKYCLPEAFKTSLVWTINLRSLQNFLNLRSSKSALWEIRNLAKAIFEEIPEEYKYLLEDFIHGE